MSNRKRTFFAVLILYCAFADCTSAQWESDTSVLELQTYALRHVPPTEMRRMLTELLGDAASSVKIIADSEHGELIIQGDKAAQKLASQLVKQVDVPGPGDDSVQLLKRYPVQRQLNDSLVTRLRKTFGESIKVTTDPDKTSLMVAASQDVHDSIGRLLRPAPRSTVAPSDEGAALREIEVADRSTLFPNAVLSSVARRNETKSIELRNLTTRQCQLALSKLLGRQFQDVGASEFRFTSTVGRVNVRFNSDRNLCQLNGDAELSKQFVALIESLQASQAENTNQAFRFVPLKNVRPDVLQKAIRTWKRTSGRGQVIDEKSQSFLGHANPFRPASFPAQVNDGGNAISNPNGAAQEGEKDLRRPSSDVTVEPLPDLDVLVLRGRDPDVDELVQIIQEIERLSDETAPEIDVYHLRHVKGSALNELIEAVLDDLTEPLQGRISITPVVKPNALLLIGWGEAVTAAKKLIGRLDRPVSPNSQLQVFSLKHAPASEVSESIETFLNGRGGLAPDVLITANPRTNSLIVNASPRDLEEVAELIKRLDVGSSASINKAKMYRLKNSLAADVAETITSAIAAARGGDSGRSAALEMLLVQPDGEEVVASGLLDSVSLTPDVRTNSIFITGPIESLPLVEQLLKQFDENPASSAQIKVFQISNGDATDLVTVLRSLFPEAATSNVPQLATAEGEASTVPVRFSVDVRTNTIVATGTTGDLKIIEALLLRLDQTESQERVNRVYRLKNSPATDVAQAVNDFLRSERIVSQAAPGRENPFAQIEQEVVVVPEPVRNSLIISATPRYFEQILKLVEDLDDQPPQVMIQVILAEVDLDNFHEFGIELGLQDSLLFDRSLLGDLLTTTVTSSTSTPAGVVTSTQEQILGASNTPGFDFNNNPLGNSGSTQSLASAGNVAGQALSHFSLGRINSDLGYGGLVLSASSENVSVMLRALDQSGSMEVLSRPQIMTLDNQQAFIQVGQRVPRIVSSQLTQLGQINSLSLEDVGLLLGVTPRISPEGMVVMEIDAEKSEVGDERDGIPISVSSDGSVIRSPRVDVTTAQTTVSAASGQTIVIGGLITNSNKSLSRKVPWLGDLPLLGKMFRYDGYTNRRTELLIILTPHVILGRSEAEYLKQVEMSRMSWVSGDVFEWLSTPELNSQTMDDNGVPVIFPDEDTSVPTIELNPIPQSEGAGQQTRGDLILPPMTNTAKQRDSLRRKTFESSLDTKRDIAKISYDEFDKSKSKIDTAAATNAEPLRSRSGDAKQGRSKQSRSSGRRFFNWFGGSK